MAVTCPACGQRLSELPAGHEMAAAADAYGRVTLICSDGVMLATPAGYRV